MQYMNHFDRLESLAQRLIEGTFSRLFQPKLPATPYQSHIKTKESVTITAPTMANRWRVRMGVKQFLLGAPVINIGSASDNDIVLYDPTVARYHAQLRWRKGQYHLYPPDKNNGSYALIRDRRHPLAPGDVITLGQTSLTIVVEN